MPIRRIGVVGLGHMGMPIVQHLREAGYAVAGYDVNARAMQRLSQYGGVSCDSPRAVAERSDMVIIVVGFGSEVQTVMDGPDGLWQGLQAGQILAVASTVSSDLMRTLDQEGSARGIGVIDVPLIRGEAAAQEGRLLLLTGGEARWLEMAHPVLSAFAADIVRLGPVGSGQIGKALNNYLLWANTCANFEMFEVAAAYGLDAEATRSALQMGSGANQVLADWNRPRLMPWAEKDMTIVLELSDQLGLSLPLAGVVKERVKAIKRAKHLDTPQPLH